MTNYRYLVVLRRLIFRVNFCYRAPCKFPHKTITFHVDVGSNPNYFSVLIEFADGDGSLAGVELRETRLRNRAVWRPMKWSWGALWKLDSGPQLNAPFSIRLTAQHSGRKLVANNVIRPSGGQGPRTDPLLTLVRCSSLVLVVVHACCVT